MKHSEVMKAAIRNLYRAKDCMGKGVTFECAIRMAVRMDVGNFPSSHCAEVERVAKSMYNHAFRRLFNIDEMEDIALTRTIERIEQDYTEEQLREMGVDNASEAV